MRLGIAGYHRGFELKEKIVAELKALGHEVVDFGAYELAQKIKDDFPRIRIAVVTGHDLPEYRRAARQQGVDRFFCKGFVGLERD